MVPCSGCYLKPNNVIVKCCRFTYNKFSTMLYNVLLKLPLAYINGNHYLTRSICSVNRSLVWVNRAKQSKQSHICVFRHIHFNHTRYTMLLVERLCWHTTCDTTYFHSEVFKECQCNKYIVNTVSIKSPTTIYVPTTCSVKVYH